MKKFINNPKNVVREMLKGIAFSSKKLVWDETNNAIHRKNLNSEKVMLISGGGSGHEPAHAGFVGEGLLDAAIAGEVFSSPSADKIRNVIDNLGSQKGTLLIVKNYAGDVLNFAIAKDTSRIEHIEALVVKDDISGEISGRKIERGVAGTILVHKVVGAAADKGYSLEEVKRVGQKMADNLRTIGISSSPCIIPDTGKGNFELAEGEAELGIGIHGEMGVERIKLLPADEIVQKMYSFIKKSEGFITPGVEVALIVNGMGGTALMDLYIVNNSINSIFKKQGLIVYKNLVGNFMTSLEMKGFSITVARLDNELKELLDYPCESLAWTQK